MLEKIKNHKYASVAIALFALLILYRLGAALFGGDPSGQKPGQAPVFVELGQATFGTMRQVGQYYGSLIAAQQFTVSPQVGGELEDLLVDIGDEVTSGDTLARLDAKQYHLAKEQAEHNVALAEAQAAEAKANLNLARSDLDRQESLMKKRITTQADYETFANKLHQAEARLAVAESQLSGARSQLADAELRLSYTKVTATWPEGGSRWVGQRLVNEGDLLTANTPILELVALDPLLVVVEVIERDYPKIHLGQEAELRTEAFPDEIFHGRVVRIAPVLSADTRQARVELEVPNPELRLKPGMFTEVTFVFNELENVWSVPQDVPFHRASGHIIFIADPQTQTVTLQPVTLGLVENGRVELVDSPPISGPVVFVGQHLLEDGYKYRLPGGTAGKTPPKEAEAKSAPKETSFENENDNSRRQEQLSSKDSQAQSDKAEKTKTPEDSQAINNKDNSANQAGE